MVRLNLATIILASAAYTMIGCSDNSATSIDHGQLPPSVQPSEPLKIVDPKKESAKKPKSGDGEFDLFETAQPPKRNLRNRVGEDGTLTIFYRTNSWTMDRNDVQDLSNFLHHNPRARRLIVEGHCDERGPDEFNLELGKNRANGVRDYLGGFNFDGEVEVTSYGESRPAVEGSGRGAYQRNRRVIVVPDRTVISRALEMLPAHTYLVDATGSMQGEKWQAVVDHEYVRPEAGRDPEIYAFNSGIGTRRIILKYEVVPDGNTPLWDSTGSLIEKMSRDETLTILTDGEDNQSRTYNPTTLAELARKRGVRVSTIGIGVNQATEDSLVSLAQQTGGNFYIAR